MLDYLHFLIAPLEPDNVFASLRMMPTLFVSGDPFFYFFLLIVIRYHVPPVILWIVHLVRPAALRVPAAWPEGPRYPAVTVVIAGRNPGQGIRKTIESVLNSGYPNVEVVYADDRSTDDSVEQARALERYGRVRVFANQHHSGKPTNLNIACRLARGEYIFVLDADAELQYGCISTMIAYFSDPRIGGVCANVMVRNAGDNLLTHLQEIEYAINGSLARLWRSRLGLLSILPGAATMFRAEALRRVGYYDTGLGDDTDMTLQMRKGGWRIRLALEAWIWTDQPRTIRRLMAQRVRWARNMVKVRLRKQLDFYNPRYGLNNTLLFFDHLIFRVILPLVGTYAILYALFFHPTDRAIFITSLYWLTTFLLVGKLLIANDIARTPPLGSLWLAFIYSLYRILLRFGESYAIVRELLRIRLWHPYVPKHIWKQIPHH